MELNESFFQKIYKCPWCEENNIKTLYYGKYGEKICRCLMCGMVYSDKILNKKGQEFYWKNYESKVHKKNNEKNIAKNKMYKIEADYIEKFLSLQDAKVLDVGCANGTFLDEFSVRKAICHGVEIGDEAYEYSSKKYKVYKGIFPDLKIEDKYDLVIFRGSIQYCINPKKYLKKAYEVLKNDGLIYITSSPNSESFCFNLFKEKFSIPVGAMEYYAFSESLITKFINSLGGSLIGKYHFYEETPYANIVSDIKRVAKAIEEVEKGKKISDTSPAFWDNMLTLVYKKH